MNEPISEIHQEQRAPGAGKSGHPNAALAVAPVQAGKLKQILALLDTGGLKKGLAVGVDAHWLDALKQHGGTWSVWPEAASLSEQIGQEPFILPMEDKTFDRILLVNSVEFANEDMPVIKEFHRVLKDKGELMVLVPRREKGAVTRMTARLMGFETEQIPRYYLEQDLLQLLKDGFDVHELKAFSKAFRELAQQLMFYLAGFFVSEEDGADDSRLEGYFKIAGPFFALFAAMDKLLFITKGQWLIAVGRKRIWRERRIPVLKDGRSIAEAALRTKIGSAVDLR